VILCDAFKALRRILLKLSEGTLLVVCAFQFLFIILLLERPLGVGAQEQVFGDVAPAAGDDGGRRQHAVRRNDAGKARANARGDYSKATFGG